MLLTHGNFIFTHVLLALVLATDDRFAIVPVSARGVTDGAGGSIQRTGALRFQRGEMTQQELADRIGVTRQTVNAIEATNTRVARSRVSDCACSSCRWTVFQYSDA
jgi:hypothetical protein